MKDKKWLNIDELLTKYPTHECYHLGIQEVDPSKIIGLSRSPKEIAIDAEMSSLKEKVKLNGWNDPAPEGLHLIKFPDFTYSVCNGGNHRAYLANQLHIKLISAYVDVLIPKTSLSSNALLELKKLNRQCELKAERLRQFQGIPYNEEKQQLIDELDKLEQQIQFLLKTEALKLGLMFE